MVLWCPPTHAGTIGRTGPSLNCHHRGAPLQLVPATYRTQVLDHTAGCTTTGGETNVYVGRASAGLGSAHTWRHAARQSAPPRRAKCHRPPTVLAVHQRASPAGIDPYRHAYGHR